MRGYCLLTPANRALVATLEYLHAVSSGAASRFLAALDARLELLASNPLSGRHRPEFHHPALRFISCQSYVVAYAPDRRPISIVAIIHGARDTPMLLERSIEVG